MNLSTVETKVRLIAQGVDWFMAVRMTMSSGCSVMYVRRGGT